MSLIGAAGMLAWRVAQRNRMGQPVHRELSRWEGEGGSLVETAESAAARSRDSGATRRGNSNGSGGGMNGASSNGAAGSPWPFPHS
ncbi:hypothetical protein [Paraburkholderia acidisoli]|uniref:Uncharacterized protein n=1 Tax=Paraburkholderia acidisoli TaxID=2571748 RepID=A0A7Z2JEG1_9BURK|nr:hypothetical protein [Paraburkholderia acidisoli]QGZ60923.1 hypothetical protein FAZ98_03770 [Paraburkholderia acidisoli]